MELLLVLWFPGKSQLMLQLSDFGGIGPLQPYPLLVGNSLAVFNDLFSKLTVGWVCDVLLLDRGVNPDLLYFPTDCIFPE